jgi:thermitase
MVRSRLCLALSLVCALVLAAPARAEDVSDQIVLQRTPGLSVTQRADVRADADVELLHALPLPAVELVTVPDGDRAAALAALRDDPRVAWAEPNQVRRAVTADPYWSWQWGLENTGQAVRGHNGTPGADIGATAAWAVSQGAGTTVAAVDSGAQLDHPDLQLVTGHDYIDGDDAPNDGNGHGTHVAGIIAAAQNGLGVSGVAPLAKVMPLRVLGDDGSGSSADSAAAFARAGDLGIAVVNASIGASGPSRAEEQAIALHPGTLYVVAAGNGSADSASAPSYPCAYPEANVLCVGASDQDDQRASFSNYGAAVDLFAPGVSILSAYKGSAWAYMSGTSMAAPEVAGAAALLASYAPQLTATQLRQLLLDSADHKDALAGLSVTGGRLNAAAALARVGAELPGASRSIPPPETATEPSASLPVAVPEPTDTSPARPGTTPPPLVLAPAVITDLRVSGGRLTFRLSAATTVSVTLERRVCVRRKCWLMIAGRRARVVAAGTQRWTIGRSLAGIALKPGRWRVTLAAPGGRRAVTFTVRARRR